MTNKMARLDTHFSTELHLLLIRAAENQGRTVTDFVAESLRAAGLKVVAEATVLCPSVEDQARFVEALLNAPEANRALVCAFERRIRLSTIH